MDVAPWCYKWHIDIYIFKNVQCAIKNTNGTTHADANTITMENANTCSYQTTRILHNQSFFCFSFSVTPRGTPPISGTKRATVWCV